MHAEDEQAVGSGSGGRGVWVHGSMVIVSFLTDLSVRPTSPRFFSAACGARTFRLLSRNASHRSSLAVRQCYGHIGLSVVVELLVSAVLCLGRVHSSEAHGS
ncbi:unnamed protein product [Boreogadus saida]